jgi:hypothetical protein
MFLSIDHVPNLHNLSGDHPNRSHATTSPFTWIWQSFFLWIMLVSSSESQDPLLILPYYLGICYNPFSSIRCWSCLNLSILVDLMLFLQESWRHFIDPISKQCIHLVQWIMLLTLVLSCLYKFINLISWLLRSHIRSRINLWPDNPHDDQEIILWVEENSHVMFFHQQSLFQLQSHSYFLSHTLMGSIYLC